MSSDWPRYTIQDLLDTKVISIQKDGNHGSNYPRAAEFGHEGVAFLTAKLLDDSGNIDFASAPRLSEEKASKFKFGFIEENDVLLSHNATVGRVAVVPNYGERVLIGTSLTHYRLDASKLLPQYLAAYFSSKDFQNQLAAVMSQTTRNQVPITAQRKLEVVVPPINLQRKLTNISGSITQKLTNNSLMNKTLEEMAQAIFKSWFVDFEPVKAKMNGEQPEGMDAATASLFPEKLVESELGLIPEGWELTNIGKVSECFDKKRIPLSKRQREQKQGSIPYYGATSVMDYVDEAIFDDIYLLIGEDGSVMKDDGTPFIQYIWGPAWVNNHAHVLQGIKSISTEQLMLFFQQTNINAYVTGAVQLKINQRNMNSIPFIKAPKEINERFYHVVAPLYAKIRAIKEENEQLAKLRDTLLPKLLSGEIELGTSEELVEAI